MEKAILIADQSGGRGVSVRDAREVSEETGSARVIQLVSPVARPVDEGVAARNEISTADSPANLDGQHPIVAGDAGGYLSQFQVYGSGVTQSVFWWGVVYDGTETAVKIYNDDPTDDGTVISQGSAAGRGGLVNLFEVGDSNVFGDVQVSGTVETDDFNSDNTLTFPGLFVERVFLGDCGGRIGIYLNVYNYSEFTYADITPLVLSAEGTFVARLETKRFERGTTDFTDYFNILRLPIQWWEVQGVEAIAVHITALGGGGTVMPYVVKG